MATVGNTYLTLADLRKQQNKNDEIAAIIEILADINPIVQDMPVQEANQGATHLTTVRSGLPEGTWRKLYQAVQPTKSTTKQVTDTTGMLEAWSEIDSKLVELSGDPAQFRLNEATAFIEGMSQDMAEGLFYNDTDVDPEKFMGLAPRFNDPDAENGDQLLDAGGSGSDNTSIWFVVWGDTTCHGLFPKGSQAGLQRDDKGMQTKETSEGVYDVHREKFQWDLGMSVRDWRYIARICNIDVTDLASDASGDSADLHELMIQAYYRVHQRRVANGSPVIYCNTTIKEFLHRQMLKANNNTNLRMREWQGEEVLTFLDMPIREVDAILNTESAVTGF